MVAFSEELLPGPVAIERVTGERPAYSTFFRWTQRGIQTPDGRRILLDFVKCGAKRKTSKEAVRRFFAAQTESARGDKSSLQYSNRSRDAAIRVAEAELQKTGF